MSDINKLLESMGDMVARREARQNSPAVKKYEQLIADMQAKYPVGTTIQDDFFINEWEGATATIAVKANPQMISFAHVNDLENVASGKHRISKNY